MRINGTNRRDHLVDTYGNDIIPGPGGNDYIHAIEGGVDRIYGDEGNDYVYGWTEGTRALGGFGPTPSYPITARRVAAEATMASYPIVSLVAAAAMTMSPMLAKVTAV